MAEVDVIITAFDRKAKNAPYNRAENEYTDVLALKCRKWRKEMKTGLKVIPIGILKFIVDAISGETGEETDVPPLALDFGDRLERWIFECVIHEDTPSSLEADIKEQNETRMMAVDTFLRVRMGGGTNFGSGIVGTPTSWLTSHLKVGTIEPENEPYGQRAFSDTLEGSTLYGYEVLVETYYFDHESSSNQIILHLNLLVAIGMTELADLGEHL